MDTNIFITIEEFNKIINYDEEMLAIWANRLTQHYWNKPYLAPIKFNGRLTRTYGRLRIEVVTEKNKVVYKNMQVEISKQFISNNKDNISIIEKIIKHELCHWYTYVYNKGIGYADGEKPFEDEIIKINSISQKDINSGKYKIK